MIEVRPLIAARWNASTEPATERRNSRPEIGAEQGAMSRILEGPAKEGERSHCKDHPSVVGHEPVHVNLDRGLSLLDLAH